MQTQRTSAAGRNIFSFCFNLLRLLFVPIWCILKYPFSFKTGNGFLRTVRKRSCDHKSCDFTKTEQISGTNKFKKSDMILPFEAMPTAKGLPILGTLPEFVMFGGAVQLHKYIDKRHHQLGTIFREQLGGCAAGSEYTVFVSSAKLISTVFSNEGTCPRHPLPDAWKLYNDQNECQRGLLFMNDEEWLTNRRLLNRFLVNGNLNWIETHILACTEKFIDNWREKAANGEFFKLENLAKQLYKLSIDVVCSIMLGYSFDLTSSVKLSSAIEEISDNVNKIFENTVNLMSFPPKIAKMLNLKIWRQFEESYTNVLRIGGNIIDMLLEISLTDDNCFIDENSVGLFKHLQEAGMEVNVIKRIFVDLILGAGDTTTFTSQWALYLLTVHSHIWYKIRKLSMTEEKVAAEYIRGFIKETLRLYPVAPFIGRYIDRDAIFGNYHIPKDTLVVISLFTAGRDVEHFVEPYAVKPERWARDKKTGQLAEVLQARASLPFGIGARSCVGQKMAMFQLQRFILEVCRNFELRCVNDDPINCVLQLITVPDKPLQLEIKLITDHDDDDELQSK